MRVVTTNVFQFDELSDDAKEKAREWFRAGSLDYEWWDAVYDDAERIAEIIGVEFSTRPVQLMGGGIRRDPCIYFRMNSGNDGAGFDGYYSYAKGCAKKIRAYAPQDTELHSLVDSLVAEQKTACYSLTARIASCRDTSVSVSVDGECGHWNESAVEQALSDFVSWIYLRLRDEFEYRMSDECVEEDIRANEYEFDENGQRA